jgi:PAS domain S-box-containing protein
MLVTHLDIAERPEDVLRESEEKYRQLFETVSDGILVFDGETCRLIDVNEKACRLYGYAREEFLELRYIDITADPDSPNDSIEQTIDGRRIQVQPCYHKKKDGTLFPAEISSSFLVLAGRRVSCRVVRDITKRRQAELELCRYQGRLEDLVRERTAELGGSNERLTIEINERKRAEAALRESQQILHMVLDTIPVRVFWKDVDSKYLGCNRSFALDAGLQSPEEIVGRNDFEIGWAEQAHQYTSDDRMIVETGVPKLGYEEPQTTPSGDRIWLRTSKVPLFDMQGRIKGVLGTYEDITVQKEAEHALQKAHGELERRVEERTAELEEANKELRQIPSKLISVQEEERKRLAVDLHDSIGQTLAALKLRLEMALNLRDKDDWSTAFDHLEQFVPILQRSIDETRSIYMGLRPPMLDGMGLFAALEWLRWEGTKLYPDRHIEFERGVAEEKIPEILKVIIFRVVQEALNNIAKHSKAEWVDISLSRNEGGIELAVSDDGLGMDLESILRTCKTGSLGLTGMKERVELTGGNFTIESTPGEGTTIRAYWPAEAKE